MLDWNNFFSWNVFLPQMLMYVKMFFNFWFAYNFELMPIKIFEKKCFISSSNKWFV